MFVSSESSGLYQKQLWKELMVSLRGNIPFPSVWKIDHHLTTTVQLPCKMPEKPVVTTNKGLFSRCGLNCAEPINFTFQRWSMPPCRSSPTTATGQVFDLLLCDTTWFAPAKTRWSTVVRPRIDHYWKLTTLQDWNTSERRFSYICDRSSAG